MGRKLRSLRVHRFRQVQPGCVLNFDGSRNVLLGRNGTGKTTLLTLVACAISGNFEPFRSDEFEIEYALEFPWGLLRCKVKQELGEATAASEELVEIPDAAEPILSAEADIDVGGRTVHFDSKEARASGRSRERQVPNQGDLRRHLHEVITSSDPAILNASVPLGMFFWLEPVRFDEGLDFFREIVGERGPRLRLNWSEAIAKREAPRVWRSGRLPVDVLRHFFQADLRELAETRNPLDAPMEKLDGLKDAVSLLGFASGSVRFPFRELKVVREQQILEFGPPAFWFTRANGSTMSHEKLSYGQRRMIALLYYLMLTPDVAIADELVNGLHHEWIAHAMNCIGSRQAFLTSQNPLLLDFLTFDSVEDVQSRFICCKAEGEEVTWANLSRADADRFFRAYEAGVQHVGEILLTKGLW